MRHVGPAHRVDVRDRAEVGVAGEHPVGAAAMVVVLWVMVRTRPILCIQFARSKATTPRSARRERRGNGAELAADVFGRVRLGIECVKLGRARRKDRG